MESFVVAAETAWSRLGEEGFTRGLEATLDYLRCLREATHAFKALAEI